MMYAGISPELAEPPMPPMDDKLLQYQYYSNQNKIGHPNKNNFHYNGPPEASDYAPMANPSYPVSPRGGEPSGDPATFGYRHSSMPTRGSSI